MAGRMIVDAGHQCNMNVYRQILHKSLQGEKQIAVLIDPDKTEKDQLSDLVLRCVAAEVDYFFVGGSLLTNGELPQVVEVLKRMTKIPVVLFPGDGLQIDSNADAILFLSLISGRNADLLIGKHVSAAPIIKEKNLEAISTGYILVESGNVTTALYMSNTQAVPAGKDDIAACTALAGEMLGMKMIFLDAGSGALNPVKLPMIRAVKNKISVPLIVGGGIKTAEKAIANCRSGADVIVVGNCLESEPGLIHEISKAVHSIHQEQSV